jgi:hypothetical protein
MASQTIVWVALPNGFNVETAPARARLSVFVAPRLRPDQPPTLAPFDFVDWPARCKRGNIEFHVVFSGVRIRADIVSQPDSDRWKALFPPETFVRPHRIDTTSGIFGSYPAAQLHDDIKAAYQAVCANSPLNHPAPDVVSPAFANVPTLFAPGVGDFAVNLASSDADNRIRLASALFQPGGPSGLADELIDLARHEAQQSFASSGRSTFVPIVPDTGDAANRFAQLAVFHQQPRGTVAAPPPMSSDTRLDFHQMLSALGEYPRILRELGLVIDLEVGLNEVPEAEADAPALVHVVPSFIVPPSHAIESVTPSTAYICKRGQVFAAAPRDDTRTETIGGFLNIGSREFRIVQIDVDGAALKTLNLIGRIASAQRSSGGAQLESAALPAMRTIGISITRAGNAELLHGVLTNGFAALSSPGTGESLTFFAEDLIRGYRVDVRSATSGAWRSLHDRAGTYTFGNLPDKLVATDEGCVQPSVVQPVLKNAVVATTLDPSAPNYMSESLFVWQGWSLTGPRPGAPLQQPLQVASVIFVCNDGSFTVAKIEAGSLAMTQSGTDLSPNWTHIVSVDGDVLFARNDGLFAVAKIEADRLVMRQSGTGLAANWTHVVAVGSGVLFVRNDGLFAVAKIDGGQLVTTQTGNSIGPNWTHVVAVGSDLLFVRDDGLAAVAKIDGDQLVMTQTGISADPNWTHVLAVGSDLLFVRNDGLFVVRKITDGKLLTTQRGNGAAPNWTHVVAVGGGVLFVRDDGLFAVAKIDGGQLVTTQTGNSAAPNWTHVVAVGGGVLFARDDGLFAVAKIEAGRLVMTQSGTNLAPNWTHVVAKAGDLILNEPPAETGLKLDVSFNVPAGSLPRLRFGESYQLRARTVDLAGNGLTLRQANGVSNPPVLPRPGENFTFLRFEPIVSPVPVFRSLPREGESIERIILRSNDGITPDAFAAAHPEYLLANERHIAPPKTSQLMAEMFGLFDASIGTGANTAQTFALVSREQGSLDDGALSPGPGSSGDGVSSNPVHPEAALKITYLPDPLGASVTFWNLPGMPERSIGRAGDNGLAITDLPLAPDKANDIRSLVLVDFGPAAAWPDLRPFRLRLSEGAGQPTWNAAERTLTVFLPKGESRTVRVSCGLREDALRLLGIQAWISEPPNRLPDSPQLAILGLLWMLTPYRELSLVHAVPQPAAAPSMSLPPPFRGLNQTFTYIGGSVRLHAGSTGRIALIGSWQELIDDPAADTVVSREVAAPVFDATLPLSGISAGGIETATIRFDPLGGVLQYLAPSVSEAFIRESISSLASDISEFRQDAFRVTGPLRNTLTTMANAWTDRFSRMFDLVNFPRWQALMADADDLATAAPFQPDDLSIDFHSIPQNIKDDATAVGASATRLSDAIKSTLDDLERFLGVRHQFGDTKHRQVSYQTVATSRFSECFAPNIVGDATREGNVQTVNVVSSASPAPPKIQYIVPAFSWTRTSLDPAQPYTSERRGALRIYLDRPWYSSGEGELLGVVLASTPSSETDPFVTHWGRDPLWFSQPLPNPERPASDAFRNPTMVAPGVSLHQEDVPSLIGRPFAPVTVVGYGVTIAGGRCFCDIEMDPGLSYHPFIRLALARFQPNSLKDRELSRVAIADFMQIAPTRSVAIVRQTADRLDVTVSGTTHQSPTDPINPGAQTGTQIRVSMQKRVEFATDDAGWLPAGDGVVVSPVVAVPNRDILWQGTVTLPTGPARGQLRLLIEELEVHKGADGTPVSRVVFAETFFVDLLAPIFATFDPGTGGPGTIVNLRGGNFNLPPVSVQFGDRTAEIEGAPNATLIKAKVPSGFTTQSRVKIKITTAGGSVVSTSDFIVVPSPIFHTFDLGTGAQGTAVNLRGENLNFAPVSVQFGDRTADIDGAPTAALIKTKVPTGFTAHSRVKIKITTAGGAVVSTSDFIVIPPPVFRTFGPGTGAQGTRVKLRGENFNLAPVSVQFGDRTAEIEAEPTATLIQAKVPSGFTAQSRVKIKITTAGGSVVSTSDFIVIPPPIFHAFDPGAGARGTSVNLRGENFNLVPLLVQFGNRTAEIDGAPTATLIKAKVPSGFVAQSPVKISITTTGGTVVSTSDFSVLIPAPVFHTFDPGTGGPGTAVNLRGENFDLSPVSVQFGDRTAEIEGAPDATLIKAKVPAGFTAQSRVKIKITTAGGSVISTSDFIVTPP